VEEYFDAKADHNNTADHGDGVSGIRFCRDGAERKDRIVDVFLQIYPGRLPSFRSVTVNRVLIRCPMRKTSAIPNDPINKEDAALD